MTSLKLCSFIVEIIIYIFLLRFIIVRLILINTNKYIFFVKKVHHFSLFYIIHYAFTRKKCF